MPLIDTIHSPHNTQVFIWKITESEATLKAGLQLQPKSLDRLQNMKAESHRKGFLAIRKILQSQGFQDADLFYDTTGKPRFSNGQEVSISHSHDFSVLVLSDEEVGIDVEKCRDKVTKIAHRFCSEHFYAKTYNAQQINHFYGVVWGTKEVVFKIENHEGISFRDHIFANPFLLDSTTIDVVLKFYEQPIFYTMHFKILEDYSIVWGRKHNKS